MGGNRIPDLGRLRGWAIVRRLTSVLVALAMVAGLIQPLIEPAYGALAATRLDWGSKPLMPTARFGLGLAAAPNGKLYAVGGSLPGSSTIVEEYDPATNVWTPKASMSTARSEFGLAAAPNGKLYAIGGIGGMQTVEEYNPATNIWTNCGGTPTQCQAMPTTRSDFGLAAAPNGKLYAIGGIGGMQTVEEYNPATNIWTNCGTTAPGNACQPMPTARRDFGLAAAPNGKLYAVGGRTAAGSLVGKVEEYDPATNIWTNCGTTAPGNACQPMPTARRDFGLAAAPNGKLYAVGGTGGLQTVEEYDPATNIWTNCGTMAPGNACQPMPTARDGLGLAAAPNGRLYAVGGTLDPTPMGAVEEYDPLANTWANMPAVQPLPVGLQFPASAVFQGRIYVFGGSGSASPQIKNAVHEYTPPANGIGPGTWRSDLAVMPTPRLGAAAVLASNNKIYVVGGIGGSGIVNTVEEFTPPVNGVGPGSWRGVPQGIQQMIATRNLPGLALSTSNNKIYVAGGGTGNGTTNLETVEEYDPVANTAWRTVAPMSQKRAALGLAESSAGTLYAVGGIDGGNPLPTVERFTVPPTTATNGTWSGSVAQLPVARGLHGLAAHNGNLFVVGGGGPAPGGPIKNDVFELDPTANGGVGAWSVNTTQPNQPIRAPMPTARVFHTVAVVGSGLYAIGGSTDGANFQTLVERAVLTQLPSASAGGPYSVMSGQAVQLNGTGNDLDGNPLTFAWDVGGSLFFNIAGQNPSTVVNLPTGTYPVYVRTLDSNGAYGVSSKTTLTVTCGPRPKVTVSTTKLSAGKIQATLTAGSAPFGTLNIGQPNRPPVNATIDVQGGPQGIFTAQSVPVSGSQVVLTVTRRNPGNAPVTVPLSVGDACGAWNSLVGFGSGI